MSTTMQCEQPQVVGRFYAHTGTLPLSALVGGVIRGSLAAVLGGGIYAFADIYIPLIYARIILVLGFGVLLGVVPARTMLSAKVRNTPAVLLVTLLVALVGYYVCWGAWIYGKALQWNQSVPMQEILLEPLRMWDVINAINDSGTWTIGHGNENVRGGALWLVWLIEAGIIFFTALKVAARMSNSTPFCEKCRQWCTAPRTIAQTVAVDAGELRQRLLGQDIAFARALPRYPAALGYFLSWSYQQCPACKQFSTLSVTSMNITRNKKGKISKSKKEIIRQLILDANQIQELADPPQVPATPIAGISVPVLSAESAVAVANAPLAAVPPRSSASATAFPASGLSVPAQSVINPTPHAQPASDDQLLDL